MRSWVSSSISFNCLLSLCKNSGQLQAYKQVYNWLRSKESCIFINKLFCSQCIDINKNNYKTSSDIGIEREIFGDDTDARQSITKWINQYEDFKQVEIEKYVPANIESILFNINIFKETWKTPFPVMKIHNAFSYTEDIKYEARLLELPMQDCDFRLVVVLPSEVYSHHGLFEKLAHGGLVAAVRSIQPSFTASSPLEAPIIEFISEIQTPVTKMNTHDHAGLATQFGKVQINENGIEVSMLTCLGSTHNPKSPIAENEEKLSGPNLEPYYFAILYKDVAIFTGRYIAK